MEDCRFCSFFRVRFEISCMVWDRLEKGGLGPKKSKPKHLLWTIYFLKVYSGPGCATVGGSRGAVDPKTMCKWVWLFFERITELADDLVSSFLYPCLTQHCL